MAYPIVRPGRTLVPIPQMVERAAENSSHRIALQMWRDNDWVSYGYGELIHMVRRLAAGLRTLGVVPGDRVALVGENCPEWAIGHLAVCWGGGVVVPLDPRLTEAERLHILRHAGAKALICSSKYVAEAKEAGVSLPGLTVVAMEGRAGIAGYAELIEDHPEGMAMSEAKLDDLAVILYTSGTTGSSKGVMLTHRNLSSNVDAIYQACDFGPGDNFFSVLPLHHVFEATTGMLAPLSAGSTITYARSLKSTEIREDLTATQATFLVAVPLLLEKILQGIHREVGRSSVLRRAFFLGLKRAAKAGNLLGRRRGSRWLLRTVRSKAGFSSLRLIVSGGAALPVWASQGLEELGFPLVQGYGLSECSPVLTTNPPSRPRNASVGLPIPGVELRLDGLDEAGHGEILARGPGIMLGYYGNQEGTDEVLDKDGWLSTGDVGYFDRDGYLHITGRKKSVIVTAGGKNIYPEEVEAVLIQSPFIEEALVVRGSNPRTGEEEVEAIVFPDYEHVDEFFNAEGLGSPGKSDVYALIGRELQERCVDLADFKRPKRFSVREEEFPKTTTRKIKRYLFERETIEVQSREKMSKQRSPLV